MHGILLFKLQQSIEIALWSDTCVILFPLTEKHSHLSNSNIRIRKAVYKTQQRVFLQFHRTNTSFFPFYPPKLNVEFSKKLRRMRPFICLRRSQWHGTRLLCQRGNLVSHGFSCYGHSIKTKFRNDVSSRGLRCPEYSCSLKNQKYSGPPCILFDSSAHTGKQIFAENNTYTLSEKRQVILDIRWKEEFIREVRGFSIISFGFLGDLLSEFEFQ